MGLSLTFDAAAVDPSHPTPVIEIKVVDGLISGNIKDADLRAVLTEIGRQSKISMNIDPDVQGHVSATFSEVPVEKVIEKLSQSHAIVFEFNQHNQTYRVVSIGAFVESPRHVTEAGDAAGVRLPAKAVDSTRSKAGRVKSIYPKRNIISVDDLVDSRGRLRYKPDELLIRFKAGTAPSAIEKVHTDIGGRVVEEIQRLRIQKIALPEGLSVDEAINAYLNSGLVDIAERHVVRYPSVTPDDTHFDQQWGLQQIAAPQAWETTTGNTGVTIAVIDSGVDYRHPDLEDNIWTNTAESSGALGDDDGNGYDDDVYGWDFGDDDPDPMDDAVSGHGTHVAGIIAAVGNNSQGITGVLWSAKLMILKVKAASSDFFESFDIIEALDYAGTNGAQVVNCSFGGDLDSPSERAAFQALEAKGILAVCAAGNDGFDLDIAGNEIYPASYEFDSIISVAAGTQSDGLASFSNWGNTSVDAMAPGVNIKSTLPVELEASVNVGETSYPAIGMEYAGTTGPDGISGPLVDCGEGYPDQFPEGQSGYIALISRSPLGDAFLFSEKVMNAQDSRAIGVIIYNNRVDEFDQNGGTLGTSISWLPTVSVTLADGADLLSNVGQTVTLVNRVIHTSDAYGLKQGTSMAAPFVAGIAGLLLTYQPAMTPQQTASAIISGVDKVPELEDKLVSGGRVNARNSLCLVDPLAGNFNCDDAVTLADVIVTLQVLSGKAVDICVPCPGGGSHPVTDGRVTTEDAFYIMQRISGSR